MASHHGIANLLLLRMVRRGRRPRRVLDLAMVCANMHRRGRATPCTVVVMLLRLWLLLLLLVMDGMGVVGGAHPLVSVDGSGVVYRCCVARTPVGSRLLIVAVIAGVGHVIPVVGILFSDFNGRNGTTITHSSSSSATTAALLAALLAGHTHAQDTKHLQCE